MFLCGFVTWESGDVDGGRVVVAGWAVRPFMEEILCGEVVVLAVGRGEA